MRRRQILAKQSLVEKAVEFTKTLMPKEKPKTVRVCPKCHNAFGRGRAVHIKYCKG